MHLGNGMVTPACAALGFGTAAVGAGVACLLERRAKRVASARPGRAADLALASAAVLAAQGVNVTMAPGAFSGHLVGGFLLAAWFGPLRALAGMGVILAAQALLYADGGWLAGGWNLVLMGVLPAVAVWPAWRRWSRNRSPRAALLGAGAAAWAAVVLAAAVCGLLLAAQPQTRAVALPLLGAHALIGLLEAALTVLALAAVAGLARVPALRGRATLAAGAATLLLAALGTGPWVSPHPDGLGWALGRLDPTAASGGLAVAVARLQEALAPWPGGGGFAGAMVGAGLVAAAILIAVAAGRRRPSSQQGRS